MENIRDIVATGKQLFDQKRYARAEEYLSRAVELNPNFADVLNMLGVIHHVEGKFTSSMEYFRKALKVNPNYTEATLNLAVLYNDLGKYSEAKQLYRKLRGKAPKHTTRIEPVLRGKLSNLHADIGDIYRSIGLFDLACDEYRKALELNPTYLDIRTKLGQALREGGKLAASVKELKSVLKSKSGYLPALVQIGVTQYAMGRTGEAKKAWKRAKANPYAEMYLRLCEATERMAKTNPARPKAKAGRNRSGRGRASKARR